MTLRELQSIIGQLQYSTCVVTPGKAFLRRMINLTIGISKPYYYVRLNKEAMQDLIMWSKFLHNYNGKSFMYDVSSTDSSRVNLYSDASGMGFGATYGSSWIQGKWPDSWKGLHITVLEAYPLLALIGTFGLKLKNSHIKFYCDNKAVVEIINKQSSKDKHVMNIVRPLVLMLLKLNIHFVAEHIPGVDNILSDSISRFQQTPSLLDSYNMKQVASIIPEDILPSNLTI